jgi:hypothetical protein
MNWYSEDNCSKIETLVESFFAEFKSVFRLSTFDCPCKAVTEMTKKMKKKNGRFDTLIVI